MRKCPTQVVTCGQRKLEALSLRTFILDCICFSTTTKMLGESLPWNWVINEVVSIKVRRGSVQSLVKIRLKTETVLDIDAENVERG